MIVRFLTTRADHSIKSSLIEVSQDFKSSLLWLFNGAIPQGAIELSFDIENRGDFPEKENLLLSAFTHDSERVLVIDNTSVSNSEIFSPELLRRITFVSHNAAHEAIWGQATGFIPARYMCTMVNDKRLYAGQEGYKFDIISLINRHLGYHMIPVWQDKDVRSEFATITYFEDKHILYNAADTIRLLAILKKQRELAAVRNQLFQINVLNSRIILPIAEAEYRGIKHDAEKWIGIARDRQQKAEVICQQLDDLIVNQYGADPNQINPELKKKILSQEKKKVKQEETKVKLQAKLEAFREKNKLHLKAAQLIVTRLTQLENTAPELESTDAGSINWGSQQQVIAVFKQIGMPLPMAKDKQTHEMKAGVGKEARANWFVNYPDSPFVPFMSQFDKYKKLIHNVNNFGEKWVEKYTNPLTGKVHTKLDQAGADTGRFTSGSKGKIKKYPNMQQIPKLPEYRACFVADEGRMLITLDYENCEGAVMTSLAKDLNMMNILKMKDSHSYLGTKCWRNIYLDRYAKTALDKWKELGENYEMNKSTPEKEKERDIFKNSGGLFPVAYGVAAAKVAATSKIPNSEGQIMINTIKAEIPDVIRLLDEKAHQAVTVGYVEHNERTYSRRWFQSVLNHLHYGWPLTKSQIAEVEFAARNSPIQGTNSDLVKEAIAMLSLYIRLFKLDIQFILTVHDEIVCSVPIEKAEEYAGKIKEIMQRAANNYLIKEVRMGVDMRIAPYWKK